MIIFTSGNGAWWLTRTFMQGKIMTVKKVANFQSPCVMCRFEWVYVKGGRMGDEL